MIHRKAEISINNWIQNDNKALLVEGARQTGKTFLIRECLKMHGDYVEINFIEQPELVELFKANSSATDIIMRLSVAAGKPLTKGKTIVFFDEVQVCSEIVTMIKFLVEEGSFKYILSGSLLGIELNDLRSAPVGYMSILTMYPLDILEFYEAVGIQNDIIRMVEDSFLNRTAVDDFIHNKLMELFYLYLIVGGMPEAVQTYLDSNDLMRVTEIHERIIDLYKLDFVRYEENKKLKLREIYDAVPSELEGKKKRFYINHLGDKSEYDRYKDDFLWLRSAGVVLPVYNVQELKLPLVVNEKRSLFKLFMSDVGLLTSRYSSDVKIHILNRNNSIKNGGLFENAVAQELASRNQKLWYFNSKKIGELDFVTELEGNVVPIEVKSGKDYSKHNALNTVTTTDTYGIKEAIVLYNGNMRCENRVTYMPIYMTTFIKENTPDSLIIRPDMISKDQGRVAN